MFDDVKPAQNIFSTGDPYNLTELHSGGAEDARLFADFLGQMLKVNPRERARAEELLEHDFAKLHAQSQLQQQRRQHQ